MEPLRRRRTICCQGLLFLGMLAVCQTAQQQAAASAPAAADSMLADTLDADVDELDFTNTTTVVQTDLPIITFGNEWNPVTLTASVISADYNRTHVAPTSGLVMFMLSGGGFDGKLTDKSVIGVSPVVPCNKTGISKATLQIEKSDGGIMIWPGDYRIIASYTGSKDGTFLASVGATPMFVSLLTFPITWSKVDVTAQKLQQMQILRDFLD